MSLTTGRTTRVIGWYHSHPHITVLPSHVDVRTHAMYQLLDSGFIGLIFSCFSEDALKVGRIQVIAFQSLDGKQQHMALTAPISHLNNASIELESSFTSSEKVLSTSGSGRVESLKQDTGDSRSTRTVKAGGRSSNLEGFFAHADVNSNLKDNTAGNYNSDSLENSPIDIDPMDMSESMQKVMHRSNLDMSGAEYVRKEIPLQVLPTSLLVRLDLPLTSFAQLQRVLFDKEQAAYNQAVLQNIRDGKVHPLAYIHHTSTYQASMCKLMEYCLSPAICALQDRLRENEIRLAMLKDEAKTFEARRVADVSMVSPRSRASTTALSSGTDSSGHRSRRRAS